MIDLYSTSPDKITVLLSGVDARFQHVTDTDRLSAVRHKYGLDSRPYIFSLGTVQPRKNYTRLIHTLAQLRAEGFDLALAIAGGKGWLEDPIYETIRDTHMQPYVHLLGFADEADLPALYSAAECVALPSLYEGFGLPVLEAMACGTPVVTSNISSLPEVAGDAALLIDPRDQEAITDAVRRLISDSQLSADLVARGLERVQQFTWDAAAVQLRQIYADLLST
ncbi:MAG: glycosyltransferase family 4 protein [Burkholderiales bacterium]|nr:glycosyltransferase family 4 protein [Anaerolineae bacterium]